MSRFPWNKKINLGLMYKNYMVYVNAQHKTWIFLHSKQILATLVMMELDIRSNISNTQKLNTRFKLQITEKNVMKAVNELSCSVYNLFSSRY